MRNDCQMDKEESRQQLPVDDDNASGPTIERGEQVPKKDTTSLDSSSAPPPFPVRRNVSPVGEDALPGSASSLRGRASSQNFQSRPTTAVSLTDTATASFPEAPKEIAHPGLDKILPNRALHPKSSTSHVGSDTGDSASLNSYVPDTEGATEEGSIFDDLPGFTPETNQNVDSGTKFEDSSTFDVGLEEIDLNFEHEFDSVGEIDSEGKNAGMNILKTLTHRRVFADNIF